MLMKLPANVLYKIFSFLTLREIYKRIARLSKESLNLTKSESFIRLLQSIYFQKVDLPLSKAKRLELPFYGFQTDAHCPNPEQWVDQIFMRTSSSLIILQNGKYIKGCLSRKNLEFKTKILQFMNILKQYLPHAQKDKLYEVQIAKIYEQSYILSEMVFDMANDVERNKITDVIQFFWNRIKDNQIFISQQKHQNLLPDFKGIVKEITISLAAGHTQEPKLLLITTNEDSNYLTKCVSRTNMIQFKGGQFDSNIRNFGYCIFKQGQGAIALIEMRDQLLVKLKFQNNETSIIEGIYIHILETKALQEGQPGSGFEYITFSGYLLD